MNTKSASSTHVGQRMHNEDAMLEAPALGLYAVADGMGGHSPGELASRLVLEHLSAAFGADPPRSPDELASRLAQAVNDASAQILDAPPEHRGMGSTVAAIVLRGRKVAIAHAGDSRVYRLRDGKFEQLTRDHSLYHDLLDQGHDPGPPEDFPYRNVITRAVGMQPEVNTDVTIDDAHVGDVYLLSTDGIHNLVDEDTLREHAAAPFIESSVERLIQAALDAGEQDNMTAVIVRVE